MRPCFAVDIDNVLARAEQEVQRLFRVITGVPWPRNTYGSAGGLDGSSLDQELVERIFVRFHEESIPRLPVLPGAKLALRRLQRQYRILIITARRETSRPQTLAWLNAHHLPFDELYHTEEKAEIPEKIVMAVDDHPLHVKAYCELGIRVFLMHQPWNQQVCHPLMTRVSGWDGLLQELHYGSVPSKPVAHSESPSPSSLLQLLYQIASEPAV